MRLFRVILMLRNLLILGILAKICIWEVFSVTRTFAVVSLFYSQLLMKQKRDLARPFNF